MAKNNNKKTETKGALIKGIIALGLAGVVAAGVCCLGFASRDTSGKWFGNFKNISGWHWSEAPTEKVESEIDNSEGSVQLSTEKADGAKFNVRKLKANEYVESGIDAQRVEAAYTATVTLANHAEATDKSITLSASFEDSAAANLNAADYISFSSTTVQSGESFTITCTQAFGYQITITGTANGVETGTKPQCSIKADYIKRFTKLSLWGGDVYPNYVPDTTVDVSDSYIDGAELTANGETISDIFVEGQSIYGLLFVQFTNATAGTITEGIKDFKMVCVDIDCEQDIETGHAFDNAEIIPANINDLNIHESFIYGYGDDNDHFEALYNLLMTAKAKAGGDYNSVKANYDSNTPTSIIAVNFTGKQSGINYTFWTKVIVNPEGLYIAAQSPSFDNSSNIVF